MQAALRAGKQLSRLRQPAARVQTRQMSSGHSVEESVAEMNKWK